MQMYSFTTKETQSKCLYFNYLQNIPQIKKVQSFESFIKLKFQ